MAGLYIHIPFCKSRCVYCGFYSTTLISLSERYVDALCREMDLRCDFLTQNDRIKTVYLGGGTPSQLSPEQLRRLFLYIYKVYDVADDAEITMECNPDDVTPEYAAFLYGLGVNRVSMGAQSFDNGRLWFIRRRHTAEQVGIAMDVIRKEGIANISIDLMFGFPGETLEEWDKDISCALSLFPQHISAYSLMFEEGTPLYRMLEKGDVEEVDEDLSLAMYNELVDRLSDAGYEHYEISNFARPGYRSRHNSSYWSGVPYIGIGAAAHSFNVLSRQWNISDVNEYISSIGKGIVPCEKEILDTPTRYDDTVMTALRTCEGVDINQIKQTFGKEYHEYLIKNAQKHMDNGVLEIKTGRLRITRKGLFISDGIMSDLMFV